MLEAFFSLDLEWAIAAIRRHFFSGHDARPLITLLQNNNRTLIQLRILMDAGALRDRVTREDLAKLAETFGKHFGEEISSTGSCNVFSASPWQIRRLMPAARKLNLRRLIRFQAEFVDAFERIINRPNEQEAVMRETAIRCLS